MKKIFNPGTFALLVICTCIASCVSKGKFLSSESRVHSLATDSSSTHHQLNDCNAHVKTLEDENSALRTHNTEVENDLQNVSSKSKMTIAEQAKRVKDLQSLIQSQKDVMNRLRKSIADALVNFKPDELSVYIKDGKHQLANR